MSKMKKDSKPEDIYKNIDKAPKSIQKIVRPIMNMNKIKKISIF